MNTSCTLEFFRLIALLFAKLVCYTKEAPIHRKSFSDGLGNHHNPRTVHTWYMYVIFLSGILQHCVDRGLGTAHGSNKE